jgi:hypothetical protein
MYNAAADRLTNAAERVEQYRADLAAMADGLDGKRWGVEVHGPIRDMDGHLAAVEGIYRDLAGQMQQQGDNVSDAHDRAPWVPDTLLDDEHNGFAGQSTPTTPGNPVMDNTEPDKTEPTVTYTTPEAPRNDFDDYRPGKGLDSVADTVAYLKGNWLATEVTPITTPTGVKFEVTGPRRHIEQLADLYGQTLPSAAASPEPKPAAAPQPDPTPAPEPAAPVTGAMSAKPLHENGWGDITSSPVHYHDDGPIGMAVNRMGQDRHLDVDGEPLANVLGVMATDVVRGRRTAQQGVDDLKALQARLPEGSNARNSLSWAIRDMDAPPQPVPAVPDSTPEPLRKLVADLNAIPIVRNDPSREMEPLLDLINDFAAGRTGGFRMKDGLRRLRNKRHESLGDCGKFEIDHAVDTAVKALEALPREALMPPEKNA